MAKCIKAFILSNGPAVIYLNIKKKNIANSLTNYARMCYNDYVR